MTWTAPTVERTEPFRSMPEREMYEAWLDYHRQTLLWKCSGLTAEQLEVAGCPPSDLTLLGLVRHLARVEQFWFRRNLLGLADEAPVFDEPFDVAGADAEEVFATFHASVAAARAAAEGRSLDDTFTHIRHGTVLSLRWIYVHLIEEYARHNGHADLLREAVDGSVGD
jgi:uncharacterized damage-inducible protein DinB